jgi:hypothetical protein
MDPVSAGRVIVVVTGEAMPGPVTAISMDVQSAKMVRGSPSRGAGGQFTRTFKRAKPSGTGSVASSSTTTMTGFGGEPSSGWPGLVAEPQPLKPAATHNPMVSVANLPILRVPPNA